MIEDDENNLLLCFVKRVEDEDNQLKFYFTDKEMIDDVVGDNWDINCNFNVKPPHKAYIKETYIVKTKKIEFDLLTESDFFSYNDGADKVIALCYEISENQTSYKKLVFHFGDSLKVVSDKFYNREIVFNINK